MAKKATIESLESISQQTLCKLLQISRNTLLDWEKQGLPRGKDKAYNLFDALPWIREYLDKKVQKQQATKASPAMERQREAKAALLEIELKQKQGLLLDKAAVEARDIQKILAIKQSLLNVPSKLSPSLADRPAREIAAELTREIKEIIEEFAR